MFYSCAKDNPVPIFQYFQKFFLKLNYRTLIWITPTLYEKFLIDDNVGLFWGDCVCGSGWVMKVTSLLRTLLLGIDALLRSLFLSFPLSDAPTFPFPFSLSKWSCKVCFCSVCKLDPKLSLGSAGVDVRNWGRAHHLR